MKKIIQRSTLFFLIICTGLLQNSIGQTLSELLTTGWEFYKSDLASPWEAFRPANLSPLPFWEQVNLQHSYNAYDAVDPDAPYYQGPAW
jgi:beta-galactosidase